VTLKQICQIITSQIMISYFLSTGIEKIRIPNKKCLKIIFLAINLFNSMFFWRSIHSLEKHCSSLILKQVEICQFSFLNSVGKTVERQELEKMLMSILVALQYMNIWQGCQFWMMFFIICQFSNYFRYNILLCNNGSIILFLSLRGHSKNMC